jgi:hypothetical protein
MRAIFTQNEIEEAIRIRLRKQITIKKNAQIDIEFDNSDDGFVANILIGEKIAAKPTTAKTITSNATETVPPAAPEADEVVEAPKRRGRPPKAVTEARQAAETTEVDTPVEAEAEVAAEPEVEEEIPAEVKEAYEAEQAALAKDSQQEQPEAETEEDTKEEAVAAAPKKSIFGNLNRPTNAE